MLSSLFEVYDPYIYVGNLSLGWLVLVFYLFIVTLGMWVVGSSSGWVSGLMFSYIEREFTLLIGGRAVNKGGIIFLVVLYFYILVVNLLGLLPYCFSDSSHLAFSLSLSLPFWLGFMLVGWFNFTTGMLAHLVPVGTPLGLIPLMVLIETVSNFIRPWSLAVRLMANMTSGHLLMSLLGDCGVNFLLIQLALFFFEFFVCFIQSYVFSALLTLYSSEI